MGARFPRAPMIQTPHYHQSFQDPWKRCSAWKKHSQEYGDFDLNEMNSAESQKLRGEAEKKMQEGKRGTELTNRLDSDGLKRQKDLIENLQRYQSRKGTNVSRFVDKAEKCKTKGELKELEKQVDEVAQGEYQRQLGLSGAFDEIDESEELPLAREKKDLGKWFKKQKLFEGEGNKIDTLIDLEENLKDRKEFRAKLKKECQKSSFVKAEYFRRLHFLPFIDSKKALLDEILKELKEVEDAPAPVQYEFAKMQKEVKGNKNTQEIKKKVLEKFNTLKGAYQKLIYGNKQYFGGKKVKMKDGQELGEAGKEFMDYIEDRENFADMEDKLKKLPGIIAERKKVYEQRDKLLAKLPENNQKKIKAYTDEMRFHTLKAYIPELEDNVESNGVNYLEFAALLDMTEHKGVSLFTGEEIAERKREFKGSSLKAQEAELFLLKDRDLDKRREMVEDYLAIPSHITKDSLNVFKASDGMTRKRMLREAQEQEQKEIENPLDFSYVDHLDAEKLQEIQARLQTNEGQDALEDLVEETENTKTYKVLDNIGTLRNRMYGVGLEMQQRDISQVDYYMEDLARWMRRSKNVFKKDYNHDNARDEWQYQEGQGVLDRYKAGVTQYSSGEMAKLNVVTNIESDSEEQRSKIKNARYATDIMITDENGKDEMDLLGTMDEKFVKWSKMYVNQILAKLFGQMGLNPALLSVLMNSTTVKKAVAKGSVMEEFDNYTMPANNEDHYINEMAA